MRLNCRVLPEFQLKKLADKIIDAEHSKEIK